MKFVCDSSVAFKWSVPEIDSDKAIRLRDNFRSGVHELLAPKLFRLEVANALTKAERQKRIPPAQSSIMWADIMTTCPALFDELPLLRQAFTLSEQTKSAFYDVLYLALAIRENCQLVTGDDKVVRNLSPRYPVIPVSSLLGAIRAISL